jgi:gas vesicle protein
LGTWVNKILERRNEMERESGNGFLTGLLLGVVIGAAVGLLYAPQPGAETRQMLKEKADAARARAAELAQKAKEAADEANRKLKERLKFSKETA